LICIYAAFAKNSPWTEVTSKLKRSAEWVTYFLNDSGDSFFFVLFAKKAKHTQTNE